MQDFGPSFASGHRVPPPAGAAYADHMLLRNPVCAILEAAMKKLSLCLLAAATLFAGWEEVLRTTAGQKIEVSTRTGESARGAFVSASETGLVVREKGGERSIARGGIRKVRVADSERREGNWLFGTVIGAGVGFAIEWAVCPHCANEGAAGKFTGPATALGAGIGAGIGAAGRFLPAPMRTIYKAK